MITAEVVFDVDAIKVGKYTIFVNDESMDGIVYDIYQGKKHIGHIFPLEDAIKHCLEQSQ